MLNSLSTGASCMTTIHLDDVRGLPDRMYNMLGSCDITERFINNIYKYIDVGVLVESDAKERRWITQMAFYDNEGGRNTCTVLYDREGITPQQIPEAYQRRFLRYGIENPYQTA